LDDSLLLHERECGWEDKGWQRFWNSWPPG
jgi:hypothetical protein